MGEGVCFSLLVMTAKVGQGLLINTITGYICVYSVFGGSNILSDCFSYGIKGLESFPRSVSPLIHVITFECGAVVIHEKSNWQE